MAEKKPSKVKPQPSPPHPIQPVVTDRSGVQRFKANAIVRYLLDNGGINLNQLACMDFSRGDWQQFAQLIGYSLSGYGDLSYVTHHAYQAAQAQADHGPTADAALIEELRTERDELRDALREPMAKLFGVHPNDLNQ